MVIMGEVGLAGEVRGVGGLTERLKEARRLGFSKALAPQREAKGLKIEGLSLTGLSDVAQLLSGQLGFRGGGKRD
jgi:DNA repair protein RadA/Sms